MKNRISLLLGIALPAILLVSQRATVQAKAFPDVISLPNGFRPEGLAIGRGNTIYTGSIATGAIYQADLRTGAGSILVQPQPGRAAVGLAVDPRTNYLYVAGGPTGRAFVYDAATGATVGNYQLTTASPTFVNAVVVTRDAAYFTNSSQPELYRVPLSPGGKLSGAESVQTIPLGGEFQFVSGQFNANGIVASPNGKYLVIVHTALGKLYRVDPATGQATEIDLNGGSVANGDGLLLLGHTLYVVQNFSNRISVVQLNPNFTSGTIQGDITSPLFDVPTSVANRGGSLYIVNARFTTPPSANTTYTVVQVNRNAVH